MAYRNALEDPWEEAREDMYTRSVSPEQAPAKPTYLDMDFEGCNPVAIDGQKLSPASLLTQLNKVEPPIGIFAAVMAPRLGPTPCVVAALGQHSVAASGSTGSDVHLRCIEVSLH